MQAPHSVIGEFGILQHEIKKAAIREERGDLTEREQSWLGEEVCMKRESLGKRMGKVIQLRKQPTPRNTDHGQARQ